MYWTLTSIFAPSVILNGCPVRSEALQHPRQHARTNSRLLQRLSPDDGPPNGIEFTYNVTGHELARRIGETVTWREFRKSMTKDETWREVASEFYSARNQAFNRYWKGSNLSESCPVYGK